jgi:serine/threonine-protein kinase
MSPEQLKNAKMVDPRSDLWSVGVMFYEMLTGREAFDADTEFGRLTAVLTQEPAPIDRDNPQLAPWRDFFARALSRDLNGRFQSADEMATMLLTLARGGSIPPQAERVSKRSEPPAASQTSSSHVTAASPQFPTGSLTPEPAAKVEVRVATPSQGLQAPVPLWLLLVVGVVTSVAGFIAGWLVTGG